MYNLFYLEDNNHIQYLNNLLYRKGYIIFLHLLFVMFQLLEVILCPYTPQ